MTDQLTREILDRVPVKLRNEYDAAWAQYQATCRAWPPGAPQRRNAYEQARKFEDKHHAATTKAAAEIRRENDKAKAKALSG